MTQLHSESHGRDPVHKPSEAQRLPLNDQLIRGVMDKTLRFSALCEMDGRTLLVDEDALRRGGTTLDEVPGLLFWEGPWWAYDDIARSWVRDACLAAAKGEASRREIRAKLADGSLLWIDLQVKPLRGADGEICYILASGIDISELIEHQSRIKTLLGEVNHRTKNLLAIVQSISRQISAHAEPGDVAKEISRRIGSLSATQNLIIDANWTAVDLATLARSQIRLFGNLPSELVELEGEPVMVSPQAAQNLGLALFELGYGGALRLDKSSEPRRFRLRWTIDRDRFRLTWTEIDGQMVPRPPLGSFSKLVLDRMIPAALDGSTGWGSADTERCWTLDCPKSKIAVSDSSEIEYHFAQTID